MIFSIDRNILLIQLQRIIKLWLKLQLIFYNYSKIITIQLTSYLNLKPVNWNFVNNRLTVQLSGFGSQPYKVAIFLDLLSDCLTH